MRELIDDLKVALPVAFRSEEYQTRRGAVDTGFQKKQGEAFGQLQAKAGARDIAILRTPMGFALALTKDGQIVRPEEFAAWPEEKRRNVQAAIEDLEKQFERIARQIPQREKEHRDGICRLNRKPRSLRSAILSRGENTLCGSPQGSRAFGASARRAYRQRGDVRCQERG
jgi:hypothetical protein